MLRVIHGGHWSGKFMTAATLGVLLCVVPMSTVHAAEPAATEAEAKTEEAPSLPMSEDGRIHPIGSSAQYFSDLGRGGYALYERSCSRCHGHFGEGVGYAPGLLSEKELDGYKTRRRFHAEFNRLTEVHGPILNGTDGNPRLGFNQLEIIAKYLRELGLWVRDTGDSGTSAGG